MMRALLISLCLAALAAPAAVASPRGGEPPPRVEWRQLSPEQRELLAEFESQWDRMPPQRQARLVRGSQRLLAMPPHEREQARKRMEEWRGMSREERRELRRRYREFDDLSPEEQAQIRENFKKFQDLDPEQRRALRERFKAERERREHHGEHRRGERPDQDRKRMRRQVVPPEEGPLLPPER